MQLPGPIRAAIGLAATVADEARHLPDRAIELPMLAVSTALQLSLRAQQRYAGLTARGDEILTGRSVGDEPPPWATFDDDPAPGSDDPALAGDDLRTLARTQLGDSPDAEQLLDELFGPSGADSRTPAGPDAEPELTPPTPIAAGKKSLSAKKAATKPAPGKATSSTGAVTKKAGKTVSKPRHTAPSKFDDVDD